LARQRETASDTVFDRFVGVVRTFIGVALLVHALITAVHGFHPIAGGILHSSNAVYALFAIEIVAGIALALDFLFRFVFSVACFVLILLMLVMLVAERLGLPDRFRRLPVALFLICMTGAFTGIGEFLLLDYLRDLRAESRQQA
jgi:hypothetical protein